MKCPEVVEWMHRYVDHDLNEEESYLLFEHLRHCEDCAEKFELLQKLSTQLDDLPLVVPKYSLVDAILPRLDAIDRARKEEESAAKEMVPVAAVTLESGSNHRGQRKETSRRSRFYRVGALGTVAAAAILGLFIYQYEPQIIPNAEINSEALDNSSNVAKMDISEPTTQSTGSGGNAADEASADKRVSQDKVVAPGSGNSLVGINDDSKGGTSGAPAATESPAKGDKMTSADRGTKDSKVTAPASGSNSNATKPGSSKQSEPPALKGSSEAGDLDPYNVMDTSIDDGDEPINRMGMGFTASVSLNQWNSPNGTYTAELQDGHLYFYKVISEVERKLIIDQAIEGSFVSGEWSQDSATFSYQIDLNGVAASHTVDPVTDSNIQAVSP